MLCEGVLNRRLQMVLMATGLTLLHGANLCAAALISPALRITRTSATDLISRCSAAESGIGKSAGGAASVLTSFRI